MSIAALSSKHYNTVFTTLKLRNGYGKHKNRNIYLNGGDVARTLNDTVQLVANINYKCYNCRYNETGAAPKVELSSGGMLNDIGLLKALQCINYQIELEYAGELTEPEKNALKNLKSIETQLSGIIISDLTEYKTADWFIE